MTKNLFLSFVSCLLMIVMLSSCYNTKKLAYFQNLLSDTSVHFVPIKQDSFLVRVQPDDIIGIDIISKDPSLSAQLNLSNSSYFAGYNGSLSTTDAGPVTVAMNNTTANGYRVDRNGNILMGMIGNVNVQGLTLPEVKEKLEKIIKTTQIKDPLIKVQLLNFRINVMGDVNKPGIIQVENRDKYSILDALNQAGDMTAYGIRKNVLLFRDSLGGKMVRHIDLTNTSSFSSDFFYLKQNDIVYVVPSPQKAVGTNAITNQYISYTFTALSLLTVIIALANR